MKKTLVGSFTSATHEFTAVPTGKQHHEVCISLLNKHTAAVDFRVRLKRGGTNYRLEIADGVDARDWVTLKSPHILEAGDRLTVLKTGGNTPEAVYHRDSSGMRALRSAEVVGFTTTSEMGLVAMAAGKSVVDFTRFEFEHRGRYHPFYHAIRQSPENPPAVLNRILNCPWSGAVHLDTDDEEAGKRFRLYKEKSLELRASFRPLIPLAQGPSPSPKRPSCPVGRDEL